jgi:hypothetical protein
VRDPVAKPPRIETVKGPSCPWPATQEDRFFRERLNGVPDDVEAYLHALVELVRSDVPLDPDTRDLLADVVEEFYFPKKREREEARRRDAFYFVQSVDKLKAWLRKNKKKPLSALDVEEMTAKFFRIEVETLRKRYQRARRLLRKR